MSKFKVLDKIIIRNRSLGGQLTFITGEQGSGKTTLMLQLLSELYKHDVCVWRGLDSAQAIQLFPYQKDIVILLKKGRKHKVRIIEERKYKKTSLEELGYEIIRYSRITDIEQKLQENKLNVLYMTIEEWREWLIKLPKIRKYTFWLTIAIDEFGEIAPAYPKGELWHKLQDLANGIKEYRKRYINLLAASQQAGEVDHRVRKKFQHRILGPGSIVEKHLRVWQKAIDNLKLGEAYICSSKFEKFTFQPLKKQTKDLQIEIL